MRSLLPSDGISSSFSILCRMIGIGQSKMKADRNMITSREASFETLGGEWYTMRAPAIQFDHPRCKGETDTVNASVSPDSIYRIAQRFSERCPASYPYLLG